LVDVVQGIKQCLVFFREIGVQDSVSECLFAYGEACRRIGQPEEAIQALRESWEICMRLERKAAAQFNQVFIAATLRDMGRYDEAIDILDKLLRTDDRLIKVRALLVATDIRRIKEQLDRAWDYLMEGFTLARALGSKAYTGIAYRLLAQLRIADKPGHLPAPDRDVPDIETSCTESI